MILRAPAEVWFSVVAAGGWAKTVSAGFKRSDGSEAAGQAMAFVNAREKTYLVGSPVRENTVRR